MKTSDLADSDQVHQLQKRLEEASEKISKLVPQIGKARQIIEFNGDMRKRALAKVTTTFLDKGESASAAESQARASYSYGEEIKELSRSLADAETTRAAWDAAKTEWESVRSLLSLEKELTK